jgi:hypothetical protein
LGKKIFAKQWDRLGGSNPIVAPEGDMVSRENRVTHDFIHNLTTDWGIRYAQIDLELLRVKAM